MNESVKYPWRGVAPSGMPYIPPYEGQVFEDGSTYAYGPMDTASGPVYYGIDQRGCYTLHSTPPKESE